MLGERNAHSLRDEPVRSVAVLRFALLFVAVVVSVQAALGFVGLLAVAPVLVLVIAVGVGVALWAAAPLRRRFGRQRTMSDVDPDAPRQSTPWTRADTAGAAAIVAAVGERAWTGLHRTTFLYDVLSYHLHLPAAWRATGRLHMVPTPFGDQAPAYAPSNAELLHHLALALTGNATLAHAGQAPFAGLAGLAIYTTARLLGAARAAGFAAAMAFLLIPEVWQQASTAMADLVLASLFLASIPFLLLLEKRRSWPDVIGLGLALGLMVGTKYIAAILSLPIALWAMFVLFRRGPGPRPVPALAVVAALVFSCGGFWYFRNVVVTGNPLFPVTISLGPFTLARGLYDSTVMRAWTYHLPDFDLHALLEILTDTGWGFLAAATLAAVITWRSRWPALALVMTSISWFIVPYQQSRFFFCAWGVGAVMLAAAATRAPRGGAAALALATAGGILQFPTPARLGLVGLVAAGALLGPGVLKFVVGLRRRSPTAAAATFAALVGITFVATVTWARTRPYAPPYGVGDAHDQGWAWIRANAHAARIAYTGSNLPLPLWGPRFENDVRYVNVSGQLDAVLHDFRDVPPSSPATAEPAPERATPNVAMWLANLDAARIDILFVAALYPILRDTIGHDDSWFPIERAWADARPDRFSLLFANSGIRIYRHRMPAGVPLPAGRGTPEPSSSGAWP